MLHRFGKMFQTKWALCLPKDGQYHVRSLCKMLSKSKVDDAAAIFRKHGISGFHQSSILQAWDSNGK
ncbi:hypothetical protein Ancab_005542 [Ancistrocladus abbreviatus]